MEIGTSVAIGSAIVASLALITTLLSNNALIRRERVYLYLELKKKFAEIYRDFPVSFTEDAIPKNEEERLILYGYWQHCFDEWYVTNKIGGRHEKQLWNEYFEPVVLRSLRHGALREAFIYSYEVEKNHNEARLEFYERIAGIYSQKHGDEIFSHKSPLLESVLKEI